MVEWLLYNCCIIIIIIIIIIYLFIRVTIALNSIFLLIIIY